MNMNVLLDLPQQQEGLSSGLALLRSPNDYLTDTQFRHKDPSRPPAHEPGDGWIVMGMLIGAAIGAASGTALAVFGNIGSVFLDLTVGAIGCGLLGTLIGDRIKPRRKK